MDDVALATGMDITVRFMKESVMDSFKYRITPEMAIGQIRAGVIRHLNIPVADQATITIKRAFPESRIETLEYEYHKTAKEMGIQEGSELEVVQPHITVKSSTGSFFRVFNLASTTLASLRKTVRKEFGLLFKDQMFIHRSTVIKRELFYLTLVEYGFKSGDAMYVIKADTAWEVDVVHPRLTWTVKVPVTLKTTMKEIKDKEHELTDAVINVPLYHHSNTRQDDLTILDCKEIFSADDHLFSYRHGSAWKMYVKTQNGKTLTIQNINPADTVLNLKYRIQDKEGIPRDQQMLIFDRKELREDDYTLYDYKMREESVVHLVLALRGCACGCLEYERRNPGDITTLYGNVKVVMPDGKSVTLDVEPVKHNMEDLKKMVNAADPKFKADRIALMFCGKILEDNVTLQQACVRNRSELQLVPLLGPSFGLESFMAEESSLALYDRYGQDMMKLIEF